MFYCNINVIAYSLRLSVNYACRFSYHASHLSWLVGLLFEKE